MKYILTLILSCTFLISYSQINHCVQDRYAQVALFDSLEIEQLLYTYAYSPTWPDTTIDTLQIEVYKPMSSVDPINQRPFILMIHGGAYYTGNRNEMAYFAMEMARRGFVTASIDYRLGWNCSPANLLTICGDCGTEADKLKVAAYRAVQDARAAIRFIIHNANQLGIDTSQIYLQGTSAGAITALHTAFWDQSESDTLCPTCVSELGQLDSSGIAPHYNFSVKGVINNCGAVSSLSVMDNANIPVIGFHDEWDCIVPYQGAKVLNCLGCTAFFYVSGSDAIRARLNNNGVCYGMNRVLSSLSHCSYPANAIIGKASCFIKNILCNQCSSHVTSNIWNIPDCTGGTTTIGVDETNENEILIYPNPSDENVYINSSLKDYTIQLFSMDGRLIYERPNNSGNTQIDISKFHPGIYQVHLITNSNEMQVKKIIIK